LIHQTPGGIARARAGVMEKEPSEPGEIGIIGKRKSKNILE